MARDAWLTPRERPILLANLLYVIGFGALSAVRLNYEFVIYAGVVALIIALVLSSQRRVQLETHVLWGLTVWGFLHMAGGHVPFGGGRLYDVLLVPISRRYEVIRYDQVVHAFGFGVATLVCHHLLRPDLRRADVHGWTLSALLVLMGMGLGALNEVLELCVVLVVPDSGVGGYFNTTFDLVANMVGALVAVTYIALRARARLRRSGGVYALTE